MEAVLLWRFGDPDVLACEQVDPPVVAPGRLIVRVRAAGVNFADVLVRSGSYPQLPSLPLIPGLELAGVVEEVGDEVDGIAVGDRVMALTNGAGGYAELAGVEARFALPLPGGKSFEAGAGFLLTYLTAFIPLTHQVRITPDTRVLVLAAAGGVGSAAVQLARHHGAHVIGAVGSDEKRAAVLAAGASTTVNYRAEDLRVAVLEATDGEGVDVVVDPVGGENFANALRTLRPLGSLIAIGSASGPWPPLDPALLVGRSIGVHGIYLGRVMQRYPALVGRAARELVSLWHKGDLASASTSSYALAHAPSAHRALESRSSTGKIVLVPG